MLPRQKPPPLTHPRAERNYLTSAIQDFLHARRKQVNAIATSTVAAELLDGGRTAHSVFKILIPVSAESTCNFSTNSDTGRKLQQVDLIIWDEIVMCHRHCIETVDRSLCDLMQTDRPFRGKFLVLAGDFTEILPVVPGGSSGQIVSACVKASPLYRECRVLRLTENMHLAALQRTLQQMWRLLTFQSSSSASGKADIKANSARNGSHYHSP